MTAVAESTEHHADTPSSHDAHHPAMSLYWMVGLALFVLTALEVSTYWWPEGWHRVTHSALIVMMVIKFVTVAAFFMHLKFDSKVLRRVFIAGLLMALFVYFGTLSAMHLWFDSGTGLYNNAPREKPIPPKPTSAPTP